MVMALPRRSARGMWVATWATVDPESKTTTWSWWMRAAAAAPIRAFSSRFSRAFVA